MSSIPIQNEPVALEDHFKSSDFQKKLKEENKNAISKLIRICFFCATFMTIEFVGGYIAGSLAIMTDAAHLLSDLAGFLISMFSLFIAMRPANPSLTYGYHRAEVIGALSSILIIWVLTVWLITEAIDRIFHPREIIGLIMMGIATCGLIFNIIMSRVLAYNPVPNVMDGKAIGQMNQEIDENLESPLLGEENENNADDNPVIRAAYIHIIGDMIQSLGVLIAAIVIYIFQDTHPGVRILDPICTFCFAIVVLCITFPVSKDCIFVLLESTPRDLDIESLYSDLSSLKGVISVHDIHLWNISIGRPSIALHIICENPGETIKIATETCKSYGIKHCTIQTETKEYNCQHEEDNDIH